MGGGNEIRAGLSPADRDRLKQFRALMAPELQERAAAILQAAVAADPGDAVAWKRLGDVRRRLGDFPAACEAYRRLRALRPDSRSAAWLHAIAAGDRLPAVQPVGRFRATPFVRIQNFLTPNEGERLRTWAFAARDRFVPGTIIEGPTAGTRRRRVDVSKRLGLATVPGACKEFSGWFVPKLRAVLPDALATLRCKDLLAGCKVTLSATAYLDGGFGMPHHDFESPLVGVCWFHREPRPFTGGDLLLHDSGAGGIYNASAFSRIEPIGGGIVFYPGSYTHEIAAVASGTDDFSAGRFAVTIQFEAGGGTGAGPTPRPRDSQSCG